MCPRYWQDSHYPSTQSAQIVRLDCPTCAWQVDLDTGLRTGVTHMKGNILHQATFATDSNGTSLPHNVSLLVAASKADSSPVGGTAISVFVRHDNDQVGHDNKNVSWSHDTLFPGPGGGRKVPRDIVVHRDKVRREVYLNGSSG